MAVEREELRSRLRELGFDEVRFARVEPGFGSKLSEWIEAGYHADMEWMERTVPKRSDPALVLPGARSVIMLGVNYWSPEIARAKGPAWARYALYSDYHDTIKAAMVAALSLRLDGMAAPRKKTADEPCRTRRCFPSRKSPDGPIRPHPARTVD